MSGTEACASMRQSKGLFCLARTSFQSSNYRHLTFHRYHYWA